MPSQLSRDTRRDVRTLRRIGLTYGGISEALHITQRQVQTAYNAPTVTPRRRRSGPPPALTLDQCEQLEAYIVSSREGRQASYAELATAMDFGVGKEAIRKAYKRLGFRRSIAIRKPPVSELNRQRRLEFAREHAHWTRDDWNKVIWSDETWIQPGRHTRTWVSRRPGEQLDDTCLIDAEQRKPGFMFWACFCGFGKGPFHIWNADSDVQGSINSENYIRYILPKIENYSRQYPGLLFMHDNAPAHSSRATKAAFAAAGIRPIWWPPYSPDLNPIEHVWNTMKNWLQRHYPEYRARNRMNRQRRIEVIQEAWEAVGESYLAALLDEMPDRMQAVIAANGMAIPY